MSALRHALLAVTVLTAALWAQEAPRVVLAGSASPIQARAQGDSFDLNCDYSHSGRYDSIVYPGQVGISHKHDFFGSPQTDEFGPHGSATTCQNDLDPSAYWAPAAFVNGSRVFPDNIKAYYIHETDGPIIGYPFGLEMLAGTGSATTAQPTDRVYYGCGSGSGISKVNYAPDCSGTGGNLQIHVIYPDCGTGALDSADHRSHTAYSSNETCPAGFPKHWPQLQMRLNYDVVDARTLKFACIDTQPTCVAGRAPFFTVHGDFVNRWNAAELSRLIATI